MESESFKIHIFFLFHQKGKRNGFNLDIVEIRENVITFPSFDLSPKVLNVNVHDPQ